MTDSSEANGTDPKSPDEPAPLAAAIDDGSAPSAERVVPAEGWYPDPNAGGANIMRYWDGGAWTEKVKEDQTEINTTRRTAVERKAILAQQLQGAAARGLRIESQSEFQAILVKGQPVNNTLHAILTIFTLLWGIVWAVVAATGGEKREMIVIDEFGNVQYQTVVARPKSRPVAIRLLIAAGIALVLGVGGLIVADTYKPTIENALTRGEVLSPEVYDTLRTISWLAIASGIVLGIVGIVRQASRPTVLSQPLPRPAPPESQPEPAPTTPTVPTPPSVASTPERAGEIAQMGDPEENVFAKSTAPKAETQEAPAQNVPERQPEASFCEQCGSPVDPGDRYCGECGS